MVAAVIDFLSRSIQLFYNLSESVGIPSYGIAIALFTLAIKALLFPLTRKQYISMAKMQEVQPELKKVQTKYKNDPERQQKEMMAVYQKYGVNPFASCLPLLIQMPILLALFSTLQKFFSPVNHPPYVNLEKANFLWIPSLGNPDPFILPILVGLGTFVQQKVTMTKGGVTTGDGPGAQSQKVMLYFMPLFIGYISRNFPAGLALYWVIYSMLSILEQYLIRREPRVVKEEA